MKGIRISAAEKRKAVLRAQHEPLEVVAKDYKVTPITLKKWASDSPQRTSPQPANSAQREAIIYLIHAKEDIERGMREGEIKGLSKAHLLMMLALEALSSGSF